MPTGVADPGWTLEQTPVWDHAEAGRHADDREGRPNAYLPPSAWQCRVSDRQEWIDLCA
jgi:hypothetical protein